MSFSLPDYFYDINLISTSVRLFLAVILGGIIGLERGAARHTAGFRTHILVCVGSCLAMLTDQYLVQEIAYHADPARLGAQVITGVGFLGVGTIIVTGRHKIKGLTTAAGLWASACIGLALGIGFYFGALLTALLIFVSLSLLVSVEHYFYDNSRVLNLYVEINSIASMKDFREKFNALGVETFETHLSKSEPVTPGGLAFHVDMIFPKGYTRSEMLELVTKIDCVDFVEEVS